MRCPGCGAMVYRKIVEENLDVCPECELHYRVGARRRIEQLVDPESFEEALAELRSTDPLNFKDRMGYKERLKQHEQSAATTEAVIVGKAYIMGRAVMLGAMDPNFIMGSMGTVVGEKVTWAIETASEADLPLIVVACSGGARMQEGILSLMQMAKTAAAVARFDESGGLYISVMVDPCTAGVAASFASLGDVHIAEPGAQIGFAGPRVIANTIRTELPAGFQRAEFLVEHGFVDRIVRRKDLRREIARIIDYCGK